MRKDGIRVTNLDSTHKIMPYLMANRCDAEVYTIERIDVTNLLKYLDKLNKTSEQNERKGNYVDFKVANPLLFYFIKKHFKHFL